MMCQSTTTSSTACCCSSTLSEVQRYFFVRVGSNTFKAPVSIIMYTFISILVIKSLFFLPKSDFKWISDVNFLASGSVFFLTRLDLDPDETYGAIRNTNCFWPMDHVMFLKKKIDPVNCVDSRHFLWKSYFIVLLFWLFSNWETIQDTSSEASVNGSILRKNMLRFVLYICDIDSTVDVT